MAKGISKTAVNLLRVSGILFGLVGAFHVLRYFLKIELKVGGFEITTLGSLILGTLLLFLSLACFLNSKK